MVKCLSRSLVSEVRQVSHYWDRRPWLWGSIKTTLQQSRSKIITVIVSSVRPISRNKEKKIELFKNSTCRFKYTQQCTFSCRNLICIIIINTLQSCCTLGEGQKSCVWLNTLWHGTHIQNIQHQFTFSWRQASELSGTINSSLFLSLIFKSLVVMWQYFKPCYKAILLHQFSSLLDEDTFCNKQVG